MTTNRPAPAPAAARPAGTWTVDYSESLCSWVVTPDARVVLTVAGVLYRVIEILLPQTSSPVVIGLVRQTKTGRDYARGGSLVLEYADDARDVPADVAEVIEYADRCAAPVYNAPAAPVAPVADDTAETFTVTLSPRGSISALDDEIIPGQTAEQVAEYRAAYSAAHGSMVSVTVRREDTPAVAADVAADGLVCAYCGQSLRWEDNVYGTPVLVGTDEWGGVCAESPVIGHAVDADTLAVDDYVTPRAMVGFPGIEHADAHHDGAHADAPADGCRWCDDAPVAAADSAPAVTTGRRSAERTTFLADVLCAALEGGVGYWSAASDIARVSESTGEQCTGDDWPWRYDAVTLWEVADGDDDCSVADGACQGHRVTLDDVARAVNKISKTRRDECPAAGGFAYRYVQAVRDASMENDAGEIDADVADIVVQVAALGSVIYG